LPFHLEAGSALFDIGSTSDHAWFITEGIASLFTTTKAGDIIEAASVGREGVVGLSGIAKRNGMALWAQVQISGEALQIGAKALQDMLKQESALYELLFEYTHALSEQRELKLPNAGAGAGRINQIAVCVKEGQTRLIVKFFEPVDSAVVCELKYATHLAAYRIELLARGEAPLDNPETRIVERPPVIGGLIGESELMREVRQEIAIAASIDLSVLITGEPGTGKELVARGIHEASSRRGGPFVDVNCAGFNQNLIESELFGHEKGAFTGAHTRKIGHFESAGGGTLFLDEIGDLLRRAR